MWDATRVLPPKSYSSYWVLIQSSGDCMNCQRAARYYVLSCNFAKLSFKMGFGSESSFWRQDIERYRSKPGWRRCNWKSALQSRFETCKASAD